MRRAPVTREGRIESFTAERTETRALGVKGVFIVRRDDFVVWARRAVEEAERRGRGDGLSASGGESADAVEGVERLAVNWSRRARVVVSVVLSDGADGMLT